MPPLPLLPPPASVASRLRHSGKWSSNSCPPINSGWQQQLAHSTPARRAAPVLAPAPSLPCRRVSMTLHISRRAPPTPGVRVMLSAAAAAECSPGTPSNGHRYQAPPQLTGFAADSSPLAAQPLPADGAPPVPRPPYPPQLQTCASQCRLCTIQRAPMKNPIPWSPHGVSHPPGPRRRRDRPGGPQRPTSTFTNHPTGWFLGHMVVRGPLGSASQTMTSPPLRLFWWSRSRVRRALRLRYLRVTIHVMVAGRDWARGLIQWGSLQSPRTTGLRCARL